MDGEFLEFVHRDRIIKGMTNRRKTELLSYPGKKREMPERLPLRISIQRY
jgi:hypothetical protein